MSQKYLGVEIQPEGAPEGHDSFVDAKAALDLALLKMKMGPTFGLPVSSANGESLACCSSAAFAIARADPSIANMMAASRAIPPPPCRALWDAIVCGDGSGEGVAVGVFAGAQGSKGPADKRPLWTRLNDGHRPELDAIAAAQSSSSTGAAHESGCGDARIAAALSLLCSHAPDKSTFVWLDMPTEIPEGAFGCSGDIGGASAEGTVSGCRSLQDADASAQALYEALPPGGLLVVACQGHEDGVKRLAEERMRCRWNQVIHLVCVDSSMRILTLRPIFAQKSLESNRSLAGGLKPQPWDDQREGLLAGMTADCFHGVAFLARKD